MSLLEVLQPIAEDFCAKSNGVWVFDRSINEGGSAAVFQVSQDGAKFALKIYDPKFMTGSEGEATLERLTLQKRLIGHNCRGLIQYHEAGEFSGTAYVIMDCLTWPDLSDCIGKIEPENVRAVFLDLVSTARFLNDNNICHRDIKPENIKVSPKHSQAILLDLGIVKSLIEEDSAGSDENGRTPFLATVQYSSPEYLIREEPPGEPGLRALTFYQLGAVLHDLIVGVPIFDEYKQRGNKYRLAFAVGSERPNVNSEIVEPDLILLARDCLVKNWRRRLELVTWERISGSTETDIKTRRQSLGLGTPPDRDTVHSGAQLEAQKHMLREGAQKVRAFIGELTTEEGYPPVQRRLRELSDTQAVVEVSFLSSSATHSDANVQFSIQLTIDPDSESFQIDFDQTIHGRDLSAIGTVSADDIVADLQLLRERVSLLLLDEYEAQLQKL